MYFVYAFTACLAVSERQFQKELRFVRLHWLFAKLSLWSYILNDLTLQMFVVVFLNSIKRAIRAARFLKVGK